MNNLLLWRRRWSTRRRILTALAYLCALAGIGFGGLSIAARVSADAASCMNSGPTDVVRAGGECVGVTDGSYTFPFASGKLAKLEGAIARENRQVRGGKDYVSVVYLMPAPNSDNDNDDAEPLKTFADQLAGAYAEQNADNYRAWHESGSVPLIQLLIASSGVNADQYREVDGIIKGDEGPDHVAAVAGIAVSLQDTVAEARDLAMTDGFPVFGSTITSDDFNNIPDLVRMAPSNQQDIEALLQYVRPSAGEGFLIYDTNPADKYSNNIGQEFVKELGMQDLVADQTYSTAQGQFSQNRIEDAAESICADYNDHPDTVLFGGRSSDLGTLIGDLSVDCPRDHITILTGDDVINISLADNAAIAVGLAHNVSVIYAGEFDPNEWDKRVRVPVKGKNQFASARQGYEKYTAALKLAFGGSATNNDNVALAYDAMLTCVTVIQQDGGSAPQASNLLSYLTAFQADNPIYGSSGPIILSGIYTGKSQQGSNPVGRMIPIMQLLPNGKSKFLRLEQAAVVSPGS